FLGLVVVNTNLWSELDLLDVNLRLVLPRGFRLLLELVAVLAVVHYARDRWIGLRSDFDQVKALALGVRKRLRGVLEPHLLALLIDQPHLLGTDCLVDPGLRFRAARRLP